MFEWIRNAYNGLIGWLRGLWDAFVAFLTDLPVVILDGALSAIAALIEAIPVPAFLQSGLGAYLSGIDPAVLYFLSRSGLTEGFALLGAGLTFRLLRKLFTLGQW